MGLQGVPSTLRQVLFAAGLDQKSDAREALPPMLDICQNVEFDDIGTLRTRKPFDRTAFTMLDTNGAAVGPVRSIFDNNGELLLFTDTALYSWVPSKSRWALRDTHLAVTVDEDNMFAINGDQTSVDQAQMGGVTVWAWIAAGYVNVAAVDSTTGAVIMAPTLVDSTGHGGDSLQLVVLSTRILLVWRDTSVAQVKVISINPAAISATIPSIPTSLGVGTCSAFDAVRVGTSDTAIVVIGRTNVLYQVSLVTAAVAVTSVNKARGGNTAIAVSVDPTGAIAQVVRVASGAPATVLGDSLNAATLADIVTGQAIGSGSGTTVTHITCAHRAVQNGGAYRCYAFWSLDESSLGFTGPSTLKAFQSKTNWVDTAGTIGTQALFIADLGMASRAFAYGSSVYVWGVFAGVTPLFGGTTFPLSAVQNTCFLYRDDARLVAKCNDNNSGGLVPGPALPRVQLITGATGFVWGSVIRRIVPLNQGNTLGTAAAYTGRAPCSVTFTFDDNRARRCVRFGRTLYITGGQILQYDGVSLTELGFHIYPWDFIAQGGIGGSLASGTYGVKATYHSVNAMGEVDRSTTATIDAITVAGPTGDVQCIVKPLYYTRKTNANIEIWRTQANPIDVSPFFLTTSQDATVLSGNNYFIPNDQTQVQILALDYLPDSTSSGPSLAVQQANPENGAVLESINPPPATIIAANDTRLFLAGVAGQPDTVWYSKTRNDGEVASFNDALTIQVPSPGGSITAIAFIDRAPIVFRQTAIYAFAGTGVDNIGQGSNYELVRIVSHDCGAPYQEAVALLDDTLLFRSGKGWYELDPTYTLHYVGAPVSAFDTDDIYSIAVLSPSHQIRIVTDRRIILRDTLINQWGEWTEFALGAVVWNGTHAIFDAAGLYPQRSDFVGITYGWDIEFAWEKPNDLQGRGLVRRIKLLGEYRGPHAIRARIANNYKTDGAGNWLYVSDKVWQVTPTVLGGPEECIFAPKYKRCEAIKVRLTAVAVDGVSAPTGDTAKLIGIAFEIAAQEGLYQALSAAQKQ